MQKNNGINKVFLPGKIVDSPRLEHNEMRFTLETVEIIAKKEEPNEHFETHKIRYSNYPAGTRLTAGMLLHIEGAIKTTFFSDTANFKGNLTEILTQKVLIVSS
ncbi:hypothetical protein AAFN85_23145 [Mucilaginibacter sp. CAU 1740]|uniref:hypothetical protein n=1 Tax=Mucilaginibacter sp. CAU 1740 TaxID=3140365 RepID=UPI00325B7E6F